MEEVGVRQDGRAGEERRREGRGEEERGRELWENALGRGRKGWVGTDELYPRLPEPMGLCRSLEIL